MSENHILCYVDGPWAYFTNIALEKQWGDDWNDAPYEHNAGDPYSDNEGQIVKVAWEGPFEAPCNYVLNTGYSVEDINGGAVVWMKQTYGKRPKVHIPAGTPLWRFCQIVRGAGGSVYVEKAD